MHLKTYPACDTFLSVKVLVRGQPYFDLRRHFGGATGIVVLHDGHEIARYVFELDLLQVFPLVVNRVKRGPKTIEEHTSDAAITTGGVLLGSPGKLVVVEVLAQCSARNRVVVTGQDASLVFTQQASKDGLVKWLSKG